MARRTLNTLLRISACAVSLAACVPAQGQTFVCCMVPQPQIENALWVGNGNLIGDFNIAANWEPNGVPYGIATFDQSPTVVIHGGVSVATLVFNTNAPQYAFGGMTLTGLGVVNHSTFAPTFNLVNSGLDNLFFENASSASNAQILVGPTSVTFDGTSTAANAEISAYSWTSYVAFQGNSSAGFAHIQNSGQISFYDNATANHAVIQSTNAYSWTSGQVEFFGHSTASAATLELNGQSFVLFADSSSGGQARFVINNQNTVDFSQTTGTNGDGNVSAGSIEGSGTLYIGPNNILSIGGNDLSANFSGVIANSYTLSGHASLTKMGNGTQTLSGVNSYTGSTVVNGGALIVDGSIASSAHVQVNNGGTLGGTGAVPATSVAPGGVLSPGHGGVGTLAVIGNLTLSQGSAYAYDIAGASGDLVTVAGNATVAGSLAVNTAGSFMLNHKYQVLAATGGVSDTFSGVNGLGPGIAAQLSYDTGGVFLSLTTQSFQSLLPAGPHANQSNVAEAVDKAVVNQGAYPVFKSLYTVSSANLESTLSHMTGQIGAGAAEVSLLLNRSFVDVLLAHDEFDRDSDSPAVQPRTRVAFAGPSSRTPLVRGRAGGLRIWGEVHGNWSSYSRDAAYGTSAANLKAEGLALGLHYPVSDKFRIGAALGFDQSWWNVKEQTGSGTARALQFGVFGLLRLGHFYVDGAATYSFSDLSTSRMLTFGGTNEYRAKIRAHNGAARLEIGRRFGRSDKASLVPYLAFMAEGAHYPGYDERTAIGSPSFALSYRAATHTMVSHEIGLEYARFLGAGTSDDPEIAIRLGWLHKYQGPIGAQASFAAVAPVEFTSFGIHSAQNAARVSLRAHIPLSPRLQIDLNFNGELSPATYSNEGQLQMSYRL
jgi:autotransporter-associated beta strand protein